MKNLLLLLFVPFFAFAQDGPYYFTNNNVQREYYLHIPDNLPANSPLVFVLHGWGGSGEGIMNTSEFNILSDQNEFAVCYPTAMINGGDGNVGLTAWNLEGMVDVEFIESLTDSLQQEYQFDVNRVFATGFSYGAEMVYHLAQCQTTNLFAGIAPVGGTMWPDLSACSPTITTSVFILHGTNDNEFNYDGGYYTGVGIYYSVDEIVSFWVGFNNCIFSTQFSLDDANNDNNYTVVSKYQSAIGQEVWLYKVNNGYHEWFNVQPSGSDDFWASQEIWNFFEQISTSDVLISEVQKSEKVLLKTIDVLGRESKYGFLINVFNDGSTERKVVLK